MPDKQNIKQNLKKLSIYLIIFGSILSCLSILKFQTAAISEFYINNNT